MDLLEFWWVSFPGEMDKRKSSQWTAAPAIAVFKAANSIHHNSSLLPFSIPLTLRTWWGDLDSQFRRVLAPDHHVLLKLWLPHLSLYHLLVWVRAKKYPKLISECQIHSFFLHWANKVQLLPVNDSQLSLPGWWWWHFSCMVVSGHKELEMAGWQT